MHRHYISLTYRRAYARRNNTALEQSIISASVPSIHGSTGCELGEGALGSLPVWGKPGTPLTC